MEQHFGGTTANDKKLRKRKKRLERLQRLQEKEENNNFTANHEHQSANLDDVRIDDVDENENINRNDYNFDADFYDDSDSDTDTESESENLNDVNNVLKQAECLLHRRKRQINTTDDIDAANKFDEILT